MESFDELHAKYRKCLALLDTTEDISEKNLLFRRLTQLLAELEQRVNSCGTSAATEGTEVEGRGFLPQRRHPAAGGAEPAMPSEWPQHGRLRVA